MENLSRSSIQYDLGNDKNDDDGTTTEGDIQSNNASEECIEEEWKNTIPVKDECYPSNLNDACTLFIGDIARFCSENEVRSLLAEAGEVENINLKKKAGVNLGYGFVRMKEKKDAVSAIRKLNGRVLCGRPIKIGWGVHNHVRSNVEDGNYDVGISRKDTKFNSRNSLFVKFTSSKVRSNI